MPPARCHRRCAVVALRAAAGAACVALALAATPGAAPAGAAARLAGNVLAVDDELGRITILDAGRKHTVDVGPVTVIRGAGSDRTLADLRRGDRVVITLSDDDASRAATIAVAGPGRLAPAGPVAGGVPSFASGVNARSLPR